MHESLSQKHKQIFGWDNSIFPTENIISVNLLIGIPARFPEVFLLYLPFASIFWPFVSQLPFVSLPAFCMEKILLRQLTFCEFFRCLSHEIKSRCLPFVSPLVAFCTRMVPLSELCISFCFEILDVSLVSLGVWITIFRELHPRHCACGI